MFETAHDLADHLSTLIDDDALVAEAVRRKFPFYRGLPQRKMPQKASRRIGEREATSGNMSKFDGFYCSELTDASFKRNMQEGSHKLLTALWVNHFPILMCLSENENCTVKRA